MITTLGQPNPPDSLLVFDQFREADVPGDGLGAAFTGVEASSVVRLWGSGPALVEFSTAGPLRRLWYKFCTKKAPAPTPAETVFRVVLSSAERLVEFKERNGAFEAMVEAARAAGQKRLVEQLEQEREVRKYENALYVEGFRKYLEPVEMKE